MVELMEELKPGQTLALRFADGLYRLPKDLSDTYVRENNQGLYRLEMPKPLNDYLIKHRVIKEASYNYPTQFEVVGLDDESIPPITRLWDRAIPQAVKAAIEYGEFCLTGMDAKHGWVSRGRVLGSDELREIADYLDSQNRRPIYD